MVEGFRGFKGLGFGGLMLGIISWGSIGRMEKNMETIIGFRVLGLRVQGLSYHNMGIYP